jgi:hypothetical protein
MTQMAQIKDRVKRSRPTSGSQAAGADRVSTFAVSPRGTFAFA